MTTEPGAEHSISHVVKYHRLIAGMTQEELAERAGISVRHIHNLEAGVSLRPRKDTLQLLATALDLDETATAALLAALPPKSMPVTPNNLPALLTRLIGREQEVSDLLQHLSSPEARLISVLGPPGVGKTRLGVEVATHALDRFPDGIYLIALAALLTPELVITTMAQTLSVKAEHPQTYFQRLIDFLYEKRVLLVLDNFEHLLPAAADLAALLEACPLLTVLVTSRVAVHIRGEQEYPLHPLVTPSLATPPPIEVMERIPAVALLLERVRHSVPTFRLTSTNAMTIATICHRLDGLPLALELAAARMKVLSPPLLLQQLDQRLAVLTGGAHDLPPRQQTLRATLAWSYDLLPSPAQCLFRQLAIFAGGATIAAVEQVCGWPPCTHGKMYEDETNNDASRWQSGEQVRSGNIALLDSLTTLIDHHLLLHEETNNDELRVTMLATIREYGWEQAQYCEEVPLLERQHATYYLEFATSAAEQLRGSDQALWLGRLEREHDNLRAALHWSQRHQDSAIGLSLVSVLWRFWFLHGHLNEGRRWLQAMLTLSQATTAMRGTKTYAQALYGAGTLAQAQGDLVPAQRLHEEGLSIRRQLHDQRAMALSLNSLGAIAYEQGNYDRLTELHTESLQIFRDLADRPGIALLLGNEGVLAQERGDYTRALHLYEESLTHFRDLGIVRDIAFTLGNMAEIVKYQGDYTRATALCEESLRMCRDLGDTWGIALTLDKMGVIAYEQSQYAPAEALYGESLTLLRDSGDQRGEANVLAHLGVVAAARAEYERARSYGEQGLAIHQARHDRRGMAYGLTQLGYVAWSQGDTSAAETYFRQGLTLYQHLNILEGVIPCLEGWALVHAAQGAMTRAAWILGTATQLREAMGTPLPPTERSRYEDVVQHVRLAVGDQVFKQLWAQGQATSLSVMMAALLGE